ncbi:MAG: uracil-DNA glycosylase [Beijerinckiaceae bacterium]|nr:uracil-DNA glycosylase [Beijerinckiaceae bacterium]
MPVAKSSAGRSGKNKAPAPAQTVSGTRDPHHNCDLCPRLHDFIAAQRLLEPDWHNGPVRSFGDHAGQLLIVGLAPGMRGANRTGRPFTGDFAGDLLYSTLHTFGFSQGEYAANPGDGLVLKNCLITNAVRCVPPQNKPTPQEIHTCRPFLTSTISGMKNLQAVVVLGRIAHETMLRMMGARLAHHPFVHGARHEVEYAGRVLALYDSYHCSRYNTNTGVLTETMFHDVFRKVRKAISQ